MTSSSPLTLSVAEAAKFFGVSTRTIRRAIATERVTYIVVDNRYSITLDSLLAFAHATPTLQKKLNTVGFGAYVSVWKMPQKDA